MSMYTPEKIKELRDALGLSLKEFGLRLGVSESTVSLWEAGKRHPKFETMKKLNELEGSLKQPA